MSIDVLVCNLTRFGDLLQCQPLLGDLHAAGYKTGLVCLDRFAGATALLRHLAGVWPMPAASFMANADKSWMQATGRVLEFTRNTLKEARPRIILNLTPTVAARLLTKLLAENGAEQAGFGLDKLGYGLNTSSWASFLAVAAGKRSNSPFNVADLLRNAALYLTGGRRGSHILANPEPEAEKWATEWTNNLLAIHGAKGLIAFQPGASEDRRRWPVRNFARLGDIIWQKARLLPVLTGTAQEMKLAEEYAGFARHPFANSMGQTSLQQLAALLQKCRLLVTNDTGTMHLAAGENVPILAFFLASAQAMDTAPMLPGSCCIEPALPCHPCAFNTQCVHNKCAEAIRPESISELITRWLESGQWQAGEDEGGSYRMWLTAKDQAGMNTVVAARKTAREDRSLWMGMLRDFWSQTLDNLDMKSPDGNIALCKGNPVPQLEACVLPTLNQTVTIINTIKELGKLTEKSPQAGKMILKNSSRLQTLLDSCAPLSTLALFWQELCAAQQNDFREFLGLISRLGHACLTLSQCIEASAQQ